MAAMAEKEPLKLIPIEEFKKLVAAIAQVPKRPDNVSGPSRERPHDDAKRTEH